MAEIVIVGGGAAGFFAAIAAARANADCKVSLFERSSQFLSKVRISGGGRCNVTHALLDPRMFTTRYPRGERELISPFHRFSADDTVAWFEARGVRLKREEDGRMFPVTDSSQTIIDCLIKEAKEAGVRLFTRKGVETARVRVEGGFDLKFNDGESIACDRLLLATVCLILPELPATKPTCHEPTRPPAVPHDLQATSSDSSPPRRTT